MVGRTLANLCCSLLSAGWMNFIISSNFFLLKGAGHKNSFVAISMMLCEDYNIMQINQRCICQVLGIKQKHSSNAFISSGHDSCT